MSIIKRYDYEAQKAVSPGIDFDPKKDKASRSMTNQADAENADVNKIIKRFESSGFIPGTDRKPMYGDFTGFPGSYHEMLAAIRRADEAFMALPAHVRNKFDNDPQKAIDWLMDEKNDKEAIELGLKDAPTAPVKDDPAPPPAAPGQPQPAA